MRQEILRRGATIERTAPDSCVAPRRGALDAPNRGMNPTATIGSSLRDAKGARPSGRFNVHHACDSQTPKTIRVVKRRKRPAPADEIWSRIMRGVGFMGFWFSFLWMRLLREARRARAARWHRRRSLPESYCREKMRPRRPCQRAL